MNLFDKKFGKGADRRRITDRRRQQFVWHHERRLRPDRRLNNILVELIPFNEVYFHPRTRDAFSSIRRRDKKAVLLRERDMPDKEPIKMARREKGRWAISYSEINIFKRNKRVRVEQRKVTDRRTANINRPYNRRVRPDRRLNNISVEWIDY